MVDFDVIISDPIDQVAGHGVPAQNANNNQHNQVIPGLSDKRKQYAFCPKILECGHTCRGVEGESECFPCQDPTCQPGANEEPIQPQDMIDMPPPDLNRKRSLINAAPSDMCGLCHIHELGSKPCVGLTCRHVYHAECIDGRIRERSTKRITMTELNCPVCKNEIELNAAQAPTELTNLLAQKKAEKEDVRQHAIQIWNQDKLEQGLTEAQKADPFKFMMEQMTLYNCYDCRRIYCGGKNDFDGALRENMDERNFLCQPCMEKALGYGKEMCEIHGNEFCDFKCQWCCSIALFVDGNGTKFYCQPCFNDMMAKKLNVKTQCVGGPECALGISKHPKATTKFPLGCSLCRSEKMEVLVKESGSGGFNIEKRNDMKQQYGHINVNVNERMNVVKGQNRPIKRAVPQAVAQADRKKDVCCTIF